MDSINVVVAGACGRMGREVVKAVSGENGLRLVGAVDIKSVGEDIGTVAGVAPLGVKVEGDLGRVLSGRGADVLVDFTAPSVVRGDIDIALSLRVNCVVGTTGFSQNDIAKLSDRAEESGVGLLIAPNFAIGAVLMMKFAKMAARFFPSVEIIELHHEKKLDAPSGTSIMTAEMIVSERKRQMNEENITGDEEIFKGARGCTVEGVRIHSVRLPGLIAHQEVIFGNQGQTLIIRHDSTSRESFMPGVILGIRKVTEIKGLVYGLDNII